MIWVAVTVIPRRIAVIQSLQRCRSLDRRDPDAFRDVQAAITVIPARLSMSNRVEPLPRQDGGVVPEIAAKPARPASWQTGFITCLKISSAEIVPTSAFSLPSVVLPRYL